MNVRVRFAPSPTGNVHIGNIRAAIFNWLFARHEGGQFLLRVEDTDRERSTPEAVHGLLDAMNWLGLDYDGKPLYQSTQLNQHRAAAEDLLQKGLAYKEDKGGQGKGECVIFKMPGTDMEFHDEVKGLLRKKAEDMKDFVIVRSDGSPVFHLANVVDDITQGTTHIIRGDDHVENTYRHVALFRALDSEAPKYAHLPMIINAQGKPFSKRDGDAYVGQFREKGYHPQALFNYLALLGWSPGEDREKMTREEMVAAFSLDRVKSGPAQMDYKKLTHMNQLYIGEQPLSEFVETLRTHLAGHDWFTAADAAYRTRVCQLMQSRIPVYTQAETLKYFFTDAIDYDMKSVEKLLKKDGVEKTLCMLKDRLTIADFIAPELEKQIHEVEVANGISPGKFNQPLRIALTGTAFGAGIYETLEMLGRERTLARLDHAIHHLCR